MVDLSKTSPSLQGEHNGKKFTAEHLDGVYNQDGDGEHPEYPRSMWREEVTMLKTIDGYWEWLAWVLETNSQKWGLVTI